MTHDAIEARVERLERQVRTLKAAAAGPAVLAVLLATIPRPHAQQTTDTCASDDSWWRTRPARNGSCSPTSTRQG